MKLSDLNTFKYKTKFSKFFLIIIDFFVLFIAILIVNLLIQNPSNKTEVIFNLKTIYFLLSTSIIFYYFTGQYKSLIKHLKSSEVYLLSFRNFCLFIIISAISFYNNQFLDLKNTFIFLYIANFGEIICRFLFKDFSFRKSPKTKKIAIYGAGEAGEQLASVLSFSKIHKVIYFLDDDISLNGKYLNGIEIISINKKTLNKLKKKIDQVFFAIPSLSNQQKYLKIKFLQEFDFPVLQVPSIEQLTDGQITNLVPIPIEELLARKSVPPMQDLLYSAINKKSVFISGAAGSIGSEICRQIIGLDPVNVVILDNSEVNLYKFQQKLKDDFHSNINIHPILGDATDFALLRMIFEKYKVNIVFHAAAYKHVPLVEENPIQGLTNNIISTLEICNAAFKTKVSKIILISSDKAVRPTNVMGASKRISEMIIQGFHKKSEEEQLKNKDFKKVFSMVRFGNVLGSSGSVVPLFKKQISKGGPITITHKDIVRYFMTITEAAQLVIQASNLSQGGEVFLLDMGEPIKIIDLAKQMINLSGLRTKDEKNKNGDIEILTTKLRPGEKLFEELLINAKSTPTIHPLIFKANENLIPINKLWNNINSLKLALNNHDEKESFRILYELVPEWEKSSEVL